MTPVLVSWCSSSLRIALIAGSAVDIKQMVYMSRRHFLSLHGHLSSRQFDTLLPELTVYEMLLYTAELKCPISVSCRTCG